MISAIFLDLQIYFMTKNFKLITMESILDLDFDDSQILKKIKREEKKADMSIISSACDIQNACDCACDIQNACDCDCNCYIQPPIINEVA